MSEFFLHPHTQKLDLHVSISYGRSLYKRSKSFDPLLLYSRYGLKVCSELCVYLLCIHGKVIPLDGLVVLSAYTEVGGSYDYDSKEEEGR